MGEKSKANKTQSLPSRSSPASKDMLVMTCVSHSENKTQSMAYKRVTDGHLTQQGPRRQRKLPEDVFTFPNLLIINIT